ncbi:MAG: PD40 domain-containing protein, partial [Gemmatimonadetes bacterium]|nr:PD40 domain-containing protein [Gemmatimonadota bacterium]
MTRHLGRFLRSALLLSAALLAAPRAHAQLPADARWRTLETPHFRVHFTEGLEPLARRAADRAERAHAQLSAALVRPPKGKVELVLTDNVDYSNGYATPLPTNRVVIYAHPPSDEPSLSFNDDWLQLVITHELTHIFHLDYAGGVWDDLRSVLGRSPVTFPETTSPPWLTEGLATYVESRLTRGGRVRGTIHEMELRTAVLEDAFFSIDRASGDPVLWPEGSARYVYGSLFVNHLAERYGPEKVSEFVRIVGGSLVPYLFDEAARRAFGISFTRAWGEWEDSLRARYRPLADSLRAAGFPEPEELTRRGRYALFPRFAPDGAALAYSASTGREETATRLLTPGGAARDLFPRTSTGPAAWLRDGRSLVYAQLDYRDPYRIFSDLYRADLGGRRARLTRGARIAEPDPSPDGRSVVAVQDVGGTNVLVRVDLATGAVRRLTQPSYDEQWSLPRWAPTGDRIAVARWRAGGYFDVVVLDPEGRVLRELTHDRAVDNEPAWSPDGRYVVFSSDRTGITDLYAYDLQ